MVLPATLQAKNSDEVKYYDHDDIFIQPYNNPILFYFRKESEIYKLIEGDVIERTGKKFRCYLGAHDFVFQKKEKYSIEDFEALRILIKRKFANYKFSSENGTFFRMIYDEKSKSYYPDFFISEMH